MTLWPEWRDSPAGQGDDPGPMPIIGEYCPKDELTVATPPWPSHTRKERLHAKWPHLVHRWRRFYSASAPGRPGAVGRALPIGAVARMGRPLPGSHGAPVLSSQERTALAVGRLRPDLRFKLSARGGRLVGNWFILSAAAAGRSLSAIR